MKIHSFCMLPVDDKIILFSAFQWRIHTVIFLSFTLLLYSHRIPIPITQEQAPLCQGPLSWLCAVAAEGKSTQHTLIPGHQGKKGRQQPAKSTRCQELAHLPFKSTGSHLLSSHFHPQILL